MGKALRGKLAGGSRGQHARVQHFGRPEAPPGRVSVVRFHKAAVWFLGPPLRRNSDTAAPRLAPAMGPLIMAFDPSPWGMGAALFDTGKAMECLHLAWDEDPPLLRRFGARIGDPAFQTHRQVLANLIVLVTWADRAKGAPFAVLGDNLGRSIVRHVSREGPPSWPLAARSLGGRRRASGARPSGIAPPSSTSSAMRFRASSLRRTTLRALHPGWRKTIVAPRSSRKCVALPGCGTSLRSTALTLRHAECRRRLSRNGPQLS